MRQSARDMAREVPRFVPRFGRVTDEVRIHNGGGTEDVAAEKLGRLFADPAESWDNLEIAVEFPRGYASVHWSGFIDDQEAVGAGFLVRLRGTWSAGSRRTRARARHGNDDRQRRWRNRADAGANLDVTKSSGGTLQLARSQR